MKDFIVSLAMSAVLTLPALAQVEDWSYSARNVCDGAAAAKQSELCAIFTGAAYATCWGVKNAVKNTCSKMNAGPAQQACVGIREVAAKRSCSLSTALTKDFCVAYQDSINDAGDCRGDWRSYKQQVMCKGLIHAWRDEDCSELTQ
jgi:hypothetical protein